MQAKPILAAVSYLNTKPFLYGLHQAGAGAYLDIELHNPKQLADSLQNGKSQIGLVPVAALPALTDFVQFGDYGIGSRGAVASVCAFSNRPIHQCKFVILDYQSRTSVALMQVLMRQYWMLDLPLVQSEPGYETRVPKDAVAVIIGDRALEARSNFEFIYDLAEGWKALTGLPFLFAAWVAHRSVPLSILDSLNRAFEFGVNHIIDAIDYYHINIPYYNIRTYLTQNIYYPIEEGQRKAQSMFLEYVSQTAQTL